MTPPAGRANFLREAPYARPWQFVKGFQRVLDFAGKELEATANGDQDVATDARGHQPRDAGRDRQKQVTPNDAVATPGA